MVLFEPHMIDFTYYKIDNRASEQFCKIKSEIVLKISEIDRSTNWRFFIPKPILFIYLILYNVEVIH